MPATLPLNRSALPGREIVCICDYCEKRKLIIERPFDKNMRNSRGRAGNLLSTMEAQRAKRAMDDAGWTYKANLTRCWCDECSPLVGRISKAMKKFAPPIPDTGPDMEKPHALSPLPDAAKAPPEIAPNPIRPFPGHETPTVEERREIYRALAEHYDVKEGI